VTIAMSAAAVVLAIYTQSLGVALFAMLGVQHLVRGGDIGRLQRPMSKQRGLLAAAAYLTTLATFAMGGWPLIIWLVS